MPRISNNDVRSRVNRREQFITNNETIITSVNNSGFYVVYSYGAHFPMYAYDPEADQWFGNSDKYSRTTTTHQSKARPSNVDIHWIDLEEMRNLVFLGSYSDYCAGRIHAGQTTH